MISLPMKVALLEMETVMELPTKKYILVTNFTLGQNSQNYVSTSHNLHALQIRWPDCIPGAIVLACNI